MTAVRPGNDKHYTHTQGVPSAVWTVTHGLRKRPSVTVVDSAGDVTLPTVAYDPDDADRLTLTFAGAMSGKAYCN